MSGIDSSPRQRPKLDRLDLKILAALQDNGRITNLKLSDLVGLSPSPCLERVKRLEAAGYIRRYRAMLDLERLYAHVTVFAEVTMKNHAPEDFIRFEAAIASRPEIVEAHTVGGGFDYVLRVVCADIRRYHQLSDELLAAGLGVDKIASYVVIATAKEYTGYPLAELGGQT